jgi:hypothetical protein
MSGLYVHMHILHIYCNNVNRRSTISNKLSMILIANIRGQTHMPMGIRFSKPNIRHTKRVADRVAWPCVYDTRNMCIDYQCGQSDVHACCNIYPDKCGALKLDFCWRLTTVEVKTLH